MGQQTKILLVGEYYSENLGDPLLCRTVQYTIRDALPDAEIIPFDISGKVGYSEYYSIQKYPIPLKIFFKLSAWFPKLFSKSAVYRSYLKDEARYIRMWCSLNALLSKNKFDVVIFAGGSLFMDYFAGVIYLLVKKLSFSKSKVIFHACGMSRLDEDSSWLFRHTLQSTRIYSVSLRDSYVRFNKLFSPKKSIAVSETFDTALCCNKYFKPSQIKQAEYGIGIMGLSEFYEQQKSIVRYFLNSSHSFKLFTNGSNYDFKIAKQILDELGIASERHCEYLEERPLTCEELVQAVTKFNYIISFRMHSQIVAASFGIPCYGFAWDDKVCDFYFKLGFPSNYSIKDVEWQSIFDALTISSNILRNRANEQGEQSQAHLLKTLYPNTH